MSDEIQDLQRRVEELENELERVKATAGRGVRRRSATTVLGLPLYDIATGPDPAKGEMRGHACGVIAIGDIATGVLAFGGYAQGLVAVGGAAVGGICIGGCALGVVLGIGGLAVGGIAIGGMAIGLVSMGGMAVGYYACGGDAAGKYLLTAQRQDPEAVEFFHRWMPWIDDWIGRGLPR
jgi:hypothetical protein